MTDNHELTTGKRLEGTSNDGSTDNSHLLIAYAPGLKKRKDNGAKETSSLDASAIMPGFMLTYDVANAHGDVRMIPSEASANSDLSSYAIQKKRLDDISSKKMLEVGEHDEFATHMAEFEARAKKKEHLDDGEIARTYAQVSRLLEAEPSSTMTQERLVKLAEQVVENASYPSGIGQGQHNTCQTAQLECLMYETNPSSAAKTIADVATTGRLVTESGRVINIDDNSLVPDREAALLGNPDGFRNYASQIFEVAAINAYWQKQTQYADFGEFVSGYTGSIGPGGSLAPIYSNGFHIEKTAQGSVRYLNGPHKEGKGILEQLVKVDHGKVKAIGDPNNSTVVSPDVPFRALNDMYFDLTGQRRENFTLARQGNRSATDVPSFTSETDLRNRLIEGLHPGSPRLIFSIFTGNSPMRERTEAYYEKAREKDLDVHQQPYGYHAIGVTKFDQEKNTVHIDGTWNSNNPILGDEDMDLDTFYELTRAPGKKR